MSLARSLLLAFLAAGPAGAAPGGSGARVADQVTEAAARLQESLPGGARESASHPFADDERFDLRLAPFFLEGVSLEEMSEESRARVGDLLSVSLGSVGRRKADEIRSLEPEVVRADREKAYFRYVLTDALGIRGDQEYYVNFFGTPGKTDPWGYRLDGHHLSVNLTVVGAGVSVTPYFLGAQPRVVPEGGAASAGLQVLAEEENTARALYLSLDEAERKQATLPLELGRGLFVGGGDRLEPSGPPRGIAYGDLSPDQQALFDAVLEAYLGNVAAQIAGRERARIEASGRDAIHFAWAGGADPGSEMYYRLQGPTLLIEFDNTVDDAEHIHTLWRDGAGDYGMDLLRDHHESAHREDAWKE